MRISTKLKISYGFFIFLPICILGSVLWGLSSLNKKNIEEKYNTGELDYSSIANPLQLVEMMCRNEYDSIREATEKKPEQFHDINYLTQINDSLSGRNVCLIVIENGELIFMGDKFAEEVTKCILNIEPTQIVEKQGIYFSAYRIMVNGIPYTAMNGKTGTVFFVTKFHGLLPQIKRLVIDFIVAMIIALMLTSGLCIWWIYRSSVGPIKKLRLATNNIKNGNLDFEINVNGNNDFAELCKDFDNMRKRLKYVSEEKISRDNESREMISNITHDLKTPITAIKGYVEGIMDGVADTDEKKERYLKTIYNKACEMDRLINELTFYSKVDTDKINYNFKKIYLSDYFADCVDDIRTDLDAAGIELKYINRLNSDTAIAADPEQFYKVINNIIGNSVKYMENEHGIVEIELYEEKNDIHIDISDNGKGIDAKDIEHVFDRFYRSDTSRNSTKGGSGIGLSIVKKIIKDHGGSVTAESEPGVRTSIKIVLDKYKEAEYGEENTDY